MAPGATGDAWSVTLDGSQVLATGCARCHCATSSLDEFCKALQHRGSTGMSISDMPDKSLVVVSKMFFPRRVIGNHQSFVLQSTKLNLVFIVEANY